MDGRKWLKRRSGCTSLRELKALEAVQLVLDPAPQILASALGGAGTDPVPFLQKQFSLLAIGLQLERGDDIVADQPGSAK